jgi:hypothetical protein
MLIHRIRVFAAILVTALYFSPMLAAPHAMAQTELRPRGQWNATVTYQTDDLVLARGSTWRARRTNLNKVPGSTNPPTGADWQLFAAGLNPLGPWSSTATYHRFDLVNHVGTTWRALRTSTNRVPGAPTSDNHWAEFGSTGPLGQVTVQTFTATSDLPDGASSSYQVFCLAGQQAIGGGARGDATDSEATSVTSSRPAISAANTEPPANGGTFTGWRTTVLNISGGIAAGIRPQVWVMCTDAP